MKLNRILLATFIASNLSYAKEIKNSFIESIELGYDNKTFLFQDGSLGTGVTVDPTNFHILSGSISFSEKLMSLSLSYEKTLSNQSEKTTINEDTLDFSYTMASLRPFSFLDFNNLQISYEELKTSTIGHLTYDFNGKLGNNGSFSNINMSGSFPLNYHLKDISAKYFFGNFKNPSTFFIGYRQINSTQPYLKTSSSSIQNFTPEIRLDEEFETKQLIVGTYQDLHKLKKGFNIQEAIIGMGPVTVKTNYDDLSGTTNEVDWSLNLGGSVVFNLPIKKSNLYFTLYTAYDVIYLHDDEDKGAGDVISETSKYGIKIDYKY